MYLHLSPEFRPLALVSVALLVRSESRALLPCGAITYREAEIDFTSFWICVDASSFGTVERTFDFDFKKADLRNGAV